MNVEEGYLRKIILLSTGKEIELNYKNESFYNIINNTGNCKLIERISTYLLINSGYITKCSNKTDEKLYKIPAQELKTTFCD